MPLFGNQCQSCGMPLVKDTEHGGTNADGSKSTEYCSLCYQNGEFLAKTQDVNEFRTMLDKIMADKGFSWFIRTLTWYQVPTLKRWKK